jgi:hypothetical protein
MANAAAIRYVNSGDWTVVDDGSVTQGWQGGVMPGAADEARINWGDNTVTVSSAVPTVFRAYPGCDESGTIIVQNGATLTMTNCLMMSVGGNPNTGTLTVDAGGTVNIGSHLWSAEVAGSVGNISVSGTVNVGGILGLGTVDFAPVASGDAYLDVYDSGLLNLTNIHSDLVNFPSIQNNSLMQVHGTGLATLPGDFVTIVQGYIDAGKIIGAVVPVFDQDFNIIQTNIVSPEPATVILLGIGGLLIRRRRA